MMNVLITFLNVLMLKIFSSVFLRSWRVVNAAQHVRHKNRLNPKNSMTMGRFVHLYCFLGWEDSYATCAGVQSGAFRRAELMYVTAGTILIMLMSLEIGQQKVAYNSRFVLITLNPPTKYNDSRREFGIFARWVRIKFLLNCYTAALPQTQVPPMPPPSLVRRTNRPLDIRAGIRNGRLYLCKVGVCRSFRLFTADPPLPSLR